MAASSFSAYNEIKIFFTMLFVIALSSNVNRLLALCLAMRTIALLVFVLRQNATDIKLFPNE